MSMISIPSKCPLCDLGELVEVGYTALPKYDPDTQSTDHSKSLKARVLACNRCGYFVLLADR